MRAKAPLILGAGPAGCAAAIVLAENGVRPVIVDRDAEARDQLCGGFLSWRTAEQLRALGVDPVKLGAAPIRAVALTAATHEVVAPLPATAFGISRRALDGALRDRALEVGARIEVDTVRATTRTEADGRRQRWSGHGLFLATGKHDVRGFGRPRVSRNPTLGLRLRLPVSPAPDERIELRLFPQGYAGIARHEDGSSNVCLAVRKSLLSKSGAPLDLVRSLAAGNAGFARRLGRGWEGTQIESIGAVPYGWIARSTEPGLFRLGDQAAVIPSLAGEGIAIALASGILAARCWLEHGPEGALWFQQKFAEEIAAPMRAARFARTLAESRFGAQAGLHVADRLPQALRRLIEASRISPEGQLAQVTAAP